MAKTKKKPSSKTLKSEKDKDTVEGIYRRVKDISLHRKKEIEDNPELSKAICALADFASKTLMSIVEPAIQTDDELVKKKDMLLVLQLAYLKMCTELLEAGVEIELPSDIPISGFVGVKPLNMEKDNVPIYY